MTTHVLSPTVRLELPDGLVIAATTDPSDALLSRFFERYDTAFILPSEKEEWSGFVDCLALNDGPAYATIEAKWGPFREWVLLVSDRNRDDAVVGGANFICYPLAEAPRDPLLSMNLNYLFVTPEHRGRGYLRRITDACTVLARRSFAQPASNAAPSLLNFLEQNDPLRLDQAAYARDSAHAGIDQVDRVRIWQRAGARIIDFPYVQPALSPDQPADEALMLSVIGATGPALDACTLKAHLERFFAISVLKGGDPFSEPVSARQLALCDQACRSKRPFPLLDPRPWLEALGDGPPYRLETALAPRSRRGAGAADRFASNIAVEGRIDRGTRRRDKQQGRP